MKLNRKRKEEGTVVVDEVKKLTSVINGMVDGMMVIDDSATIVMINPQAEKYFGIKKEIVTGRKINQAGLCDCIYELFLKAQRNKKRKVLKKDVPILFSSKDKENSIAEVSMKAVFSGKGALIGYIVVIHDITREKTVERLKNEFISVAAHQLRTPLAGIKWSLKMILDGEVGNADAETKNLLDKAYQANEIMILLVNDLLNVSKIEEGEFLFELRSVALKDVVRQVIEELKVFAESRDISIKFESEKSVVPEVKADINKLKLALRNLLENAVKYSEAGDVVTVSIHYDHDDHVQIEIKDNGIGIDKKEHKRVFSKFFRGKNATKVNVQGTGLGLFIVKNIIKTHKGKIWFESDIDRGTTFYIRLLIENGKVKH